MSWIIIIVLALITFSNRYAFFARQISYRPSVRMQRFLSYSSYAVLSAIWAPIIFQIDAQGDVSHAGGDYLIAASCAAILSFMRAPMLLTVLLSTSIFFLLRFLLFAQ